MDAGRRAGCQIKFETRIVGTDADWDLEIGGFGYNFPFPDFTVIYEHPQFFRLHFGAEGVTLSRAQAGAAAPHCGFQVNVGRAFAEFGRAANRATEFFGW